MKSAEIDTQSDRGDDSVFQTFIGLTETYSVRASNTSQEEVENRDSKRHDTRERRTFRYYFHNHND